MKKVGLTFLQFLEKVAYHPQWLTIEKDENGKHLSFLDATDSQKAMYTIGLAAQYLDKKEILLVIRKLKEVYDNADVPEEWKGVPT